MASILLKIRVGKLLEIKNCMYVWAAYSFKALPMLTGEARTWQLLKV